MTCAPAGTVAGRARSIAWLLTSALVLAACGDDPPDPRSPEAERAREQKVPTMEAAVDSVVQGLPVYGTGRRDTCEAGQDNPKVQDPYRLRCGMGYRVVAGLVAQEQRVAVDDTRRRLDRARCTGTGSNDPNRISLEAQEGIRSAALWGGAFTCSGVEIRVLLGESANTRLAEEVGESIPGPYGTTFVDEKIDATRAFLRAGQAGRKYVLIGSVAGEYYVVPR